MRENENLKITADRTDRRPISPDKLDWRQARYLIGEKAEELLKSSFGLVRDLKKEIHYHDLLREIKSTQKEQTAFMEQAQEKTPDKARDIIETVKNFVESMKESGSTSGVSNIDINNGHYQEFMDYLNDFEKEIDKAELETEANTEFEKM